MKLSDLKSIIQFDTDFADDEIYASFYTELDDILPKYADTINVLQIHTDYIVCDFSRFIRDHKVEIKDYIYDNYYLPWASNMYINMFEKQDAGYIAHFIEKDMNAFLRRDY